MKVYIMRNVGDGLRSQLGVPSDVTLREGETVDVPDNIADILVQQSVATQQLPLHGVTDGPSIAGGAVPGSDLPTSPKTFGVDPHAQSREVASWSALQRSAQTQQAPGNATQDADSQKLAENAAAAGAPQPTAQQAAARDQAAKDQAAKDAAAKK